MDPKISFLEWKKLEVNHIAIHTVGNIINLNMEIHYNKTIYDVLFKNASSICINVSGFPIQIFGFEIIDNKQNGWEKSSRYTVSDYEDNIINFICEDIILESQYS